MNRERHDEAQDDSCIVAGHEKCVTSVNRGSFSEKHASPERERNHGQLLYLLG